MDKVLLKNIFSLFSIQGINYFLPLIAVPYLVRVMGLDAFGQYSLVLAVIQYFVILSDYGFNLSATRQIAVNRENKNVVARIFWSVIFSKIIIIIFGYLILLLSFGFSDSLNANRGLLQAGYLIVIGSAFFPVWLFQGCEQMFWVAVSNFFARLTGLCLIFVFVNNGNDLLLAIIIQGVVSTLAAIIALSRGVYVGLIIYQRISLMDIKEQVVRGWDIFVSTSFVSLYTTSIPLILGATSGTASVGIYVAADKLRLALQGFIGPVSQALYPRLSKLMLDSQSEAFLLLKKVSIYLILPLVIISLVISIFSVEIVNLVYGHGYYVSGEILRILIWIPPVVAIGNLLGIQIMLPLGMSKSFSRVYILAGVLGFPLMYIFSEKYTYWGISAIALFIELLVVSIFTYMVRKQTMYKIVSK